jgi:hypothetical protein
MWFLKNKKQEKYNGPREEDYHLLSVAFKIKKDWIKEEEKRIKKLRNRRKYKVRMKTDKKIDISKLDIIDGEIVVKQDNSNQQLCPMKGFEKCTTYDCAWFDSRYNQCAIVSIGDISRVLIDK